MGEKLQGGAKTEAEKKLVYIADDDFSIREALRTFLESAGYAVCAFDQGDALFEAFSERPADLVLLDVMMPPGPSGFVICSKIRAMSRVPIIMLTARDSDLDYQTAMELGSDEYFTKPASPLLIVSRIEAIFRRVEFERAAESGPAEAFDERA